MHWNRIGEIAFEVAFEIVFEIALEIAFTKSLWKVSPRLCTYAIQLLNAPALASAAMRPAATASGKPLSKSPATSDEWRYDKCFRMPRASLQMLRSIPVRFENKHLIVASAKRLSCLGELSATSASGEWRPW